MSRTISAAPTLAAAPDDWAIEQLLSEPSPAVVESVGRLGGRWAILGVGGKMGATTAIMVRRALQLAGQGSSTVYGVSRFNQGAQREMLNRAGIKTVACDLTDSAAVALLPDAENVLFLAGQKFGTDASPGETWIQNVIMPSLVARRYAQARLVAFSTGCVYSFAAVDGAGSSESDPVGFVGEYAATCVGRERIFSHYARQLGTSLLLFRLNYAVEPRYGVLTDIAAKVRSGAALDLSTGYLNCIWQGDACARAIQCLERAANPPEILNVTGREKLSVRDIALAFGKLLGREPVFTGQPAPTAWLSNAQKSYDWFGPPRFTVEQLLPLIADYVRAGGRLLNKPTHFETRSGKF